jgi:5'-3' exonuclease
MSKYIRVKRDSSDEVYVDANDLIIGLMKKSEKSSSETERNIYKQIIKLITDIRDSSN